MDITVLDHFLVIADTQSFTKAAELLEKSESVLSRQIARLEKELDVTLFERGTRCLTLTPAGKVFQAGVTEMFEVYQQSVRKTQMAQKSLSDMFKLGIFVNHLMPDHALFLLSEFQRLYSHIHIEVESWDFRILAQKLKNGEVDFVFAAVTEYQNDPDYGIILFEEVPFWMLVSQAHPAFSKPGGAAPSLADFKDDVFYIPNHPPLCKSFINLCGAAGFTPNYILNDDQTFKFNRVQANRGISIIDDTHVFSYSAGIARVPMTNFGPIPIGLIYRAGERNKNYKLFVDYMKTHVQDEWPVK